MDSSRQRHGRCRSPSRERPPRDPGAEGGDIWLAAWHAALLVERPERWLREQCRAGRLPCQGEPNTGEVFLVPMAATEELAGHCERLQ